MCLSVSAGGRKYKHFFPFTALISSIVALFFSATGVFFFCIVVDIIINRRIYQLLGFFKFLSSYKNRVEFCFFGFKKKVKYRKLWISLTIRPSKLGPFGSFWKNSTRSSKMVQIHWIYPQKIHRTHP